MPRRIPVTVLIPAYNAQKFLPAAIATVRSQSVDVDEILVVDDESTDDTAATAEKLGARVVRERHGGLAATRNAGFAAAKSEWIATLDADDVWHSRKLGLQYDAVLAKPEVGLVFTEFDAVSESDGRIQKANVVGEYLSSENVAQSRLTPEAGLMDFKGFLRALSARGLVLPSTALFRRELAVELGGFTLETTAEDAEFFLRVASRTMTAFVDVPLVAYMRHDSQITANWELDAVRLALYHYVMTNKKNYHEIVISEFRKQYANFLYYSAANAARRRKIATAAALLTKAITVAVGSGELGALIRTVGQSERLRSVLPGGSTPVPSAIGAASEGETIREIKIPWRCKYSA
jgi:glycosyltransferase involved in cell wall biosynthesis